MNAAVVSALLQGIVTLITAIAPGAMSSAAIQKVIEGLMQLIPLVIQWIPNAIADVKMAINILKSDPNATPEQLAQLDAMSADADAQLDAAFKAAQAADAAASP